MAWQFRMGSFYSGVALCLYLQAISSGIVRPVAAQSFTYDDGPRGPAHWGDLSAIWTKCKTGKQQSPMRITPNIMVTDPELGELHAHYSEHPVPANISINPGSAVEVSVDSNVGKLKINGVTYRPAQFHFHMGNEHKILGYKVPMELHHVYEAEDDAAKRAVIAWLFVRGADNKFLAQFEDKLPFLTNETTDFTLDPSHLPKFQKSYARYQGSLTTPPCTEGITWTVMLWNFPTISQRQIDLFKIAMPIENVRPSFPSNGRKFSMNTC